MKIIFLDCRFVKVFVMVVLVWLMWYCKLIERGKKGFKVLFLFKKMVEDLKVLVVWFVLILVILLFVWIIILWLILGEVESLIDEWFLSFDNVVKYCDIFLIIFGVVLIMVIILFSD